MQRPKERKEATMIQCNNCNYIFITPIKKEIPDHTGHIDIIIDVCPLCDSNNIHGHVGNFTYEKSANIPLDQADVRHLERMKALYIKTCSQQKQATTDIDLIRHYSALIQYAEDFHEKIINYIKYGSNNKS